MKNYSENGKQEHYLNKDYTVEALWINIECYDYLTQDSQQYLARDVASGRISNDQVIGEIFGIIRKTGELVLQDEANLNRCISFIRKHFPHAAFGIADGTVCIDNLSREEMIFCLQQDDLHLDYAVIDKDGNIPEDIES